MDMDNEKAPLLEAQPESTLEQLQQKVTDAKQAWLDARQRWFDANKEYNAAWLKTPSGRVSAWVGYIFAGMGLAISAAFLVFLVLSIGYMAWDTYENGDEEYLPRRVPLEAHIMSKCPDARDCLRDLVLPAMMNVSHLVDFKLSYIGTNTDEDDGVLCMHGPSECLGNTIQLCAAHMYPDPKIHLGFTMCLSKDYKDIPSEQLIKDCALEHGISFDRLNDCVSRDDGSVGLNLLKKSVQRSADANVTKSCTVRLDGKIRCIRDGGRWTDCEGGHDVKDLVDDVLELRYQHSPEVVA